MSVTGDILGIVVAAGPYILEAQVGFPEEGAGEQKLKAVVEKITKDIETVGGVDFPSFIPAKWHPVIVKSSVQLAVTLLKLLGIDKKLKELQDFLQREYGLTLGS